MEKKHATTLAFGSLEFVAGAVSKLRYDALAKFLGGLAYYVFNDARMDQARHRPKLAQQLTLIAQHLQNARFITELAWKICEPHEAPPQPPPEVAAWIDAAMKELDQAGKSNDELAARQRDAGNDREADYSSGVGRGYRMAIGRLQRCLQTGVPTESETKALPDVTIVGRDAAAAVRQKSDVQLFCERMEQIRGLLDRIFKAATMGSNVEKLASDALNLMPEKR